MLARMTGLVRDLVVYPENMKKNLDKSKLKNKNHFLPYIIIGGLVVLVAVAVLVLNQRAVDGNIAGEAGMWTRYGSSPPGAPVGSRCTSNGQCQSKICEQGKCKSEVRSAQRPPGASGASGPALVPCTSEFGQCDPFNVNRPTLCELSTRTCKVKGGGRCQVDVECRSGRCQGWRCVYGQGEPCPAVGGSICAAGQCLFRQASRSFACINQDGDSCRFSTDCISDRCINGVCQSRPERPPQSPCQWNSDCRSDICLNNRRCS